MRDRIYLALFLTYSVVTCVLFIVT